MASSGTINGNQSGTQPYLRIAWTIVSQDIPNNRSRVKLQLILVSPYSLYFSASKTGSNNGSSFTYTGGFSGTGTRTLNTREIWVNHNSDGTRSQSVNGSFDIAVNWSGSWLSSLSVSGSMNLDTIPRASSLNSFSFGSHFRPNTTNTINLSISRASSSFTHDIQLRDGNTVLQSWNGQGLPSSLSISSGTSNTLLNRMSTSTTRLLTLRVQTKSGSSNIGSAVSRNATATIHSSVTPVASGLSISIAGNGRDSAINKYVQRISKVQASFSAGAVGGASISTRNIIVRRSSDNGNSQTISGTSGTTNNPITLSGTYEVIATVRDTRGREATQRSTFSSHAYSEPRITTFTAARNESTPTTVNITRSGNHTPLSSGDNTLSILIQRRAVGGTWTDVQGTSTNSSSFSGSVNSTSNSVTQSYEFRLYATDQFGNNAEATATISTQRVVLDVHKNEGVGIGKIHELGVLDVDGEAYFKGDLFVNGTNLSRLVSFSSAAGIPTPIEDTSTFWQSLPQGSYFVGPDSIPNQPSNYGIVVHTTQNFGSGSDFNTIWYSQSSGRVYRKSGNRSVNTEWIMIDTDSGSNSNGRWIKWGDGTQICTYQTDIYDVNATSGNIQHHYFTFPVDFVEKPAVTSSGITFRGTATVGGAFDVRNVTSSQVQITANARQLSTDIDNIRGFSYIAIGRWK